MCVSLRSTHLSIIDDAEYRSDYCISPGDVVESG